VKQKFFSLKYKFLLFSLLLVTISLTFIGVVYYRTATDVITEKVSTSNLITVRQVSNNLDHILQNTHEISLHLLQNNQLRTALKSQITPEKQVSQEEQIALTQYLLNYISLNPFVASIRIWSLDHMIASTDTISYIPDKEIRTAAKTKKGGVIWRLVKWMSFDGTERNYISLFRAIHDVNKVSSRLGTMMINIREDTLYDVYRDARLSDQGSYYLIDNNFRLISTLRRADIGSKIPGELTDNQNIFNQSGGYYTTYMNGERHLVTFFPLQQVDWWLINVIKLEDLFADLQMIQRFILMSVGAGLLICSILTYLFVYRMLDPLLKMGLLMQDIDKKDFNVRLPVRGNDEIALLSQTFNKMALRLKDLMTQIYTVRIKQREAELMALQAQIDPHFLYNSLDTIYWSSLMEPPEETADLVKALANLFRLSINSGIDITTLQKEVDHLQNFITIQRARYEDLIDFKVEVEKELLDLKVVKLVLQPLVENAIQHGIEKTGRGGNITIKIYKQNFKLVYMISDDGIGADEDELNQLRVTVAENNRGFCIKNVNDRIQLHFGSEYGLWFRSSKNQGTTAWVEQPLYDGDAEC
jgi:two-component system sensor histidine kinase YesM